MNRERFIELVEREQAPLRRFLLGLCLGNREEAEDIAQDALVKAYLNSPFFEERSKFSTWLFKIAYNTFLDRRKKAENRIVGAGLGEAERQSSCSDSDERFRYQELYNALEQIPPRERTAILLHYIGGYSVRESAVIMDCSTGAVKQLLFRGREQLKTKLDLE